MCGRSGSLAGIEEMCSSWELGSGRGWVDELLAW